MQQTMVHKAKEKTVNSMRLEFDAVSANEGLARMAAAAFVAELDPTLEEISDVKTAVSEAVTNAIIHGYEGEPGKVCMECTLQGDVLNVSVTDYGVGITDLEQAMQPLFTTKPELERSGMGFAFMEAFMDDLEVQSVPGRGTTVRMKKKCGTTPWVKDED